MAHNKWAFSIQDVRDNFNGLIADVKDNYELLKTSLDAMTPEAAAWASDGSGAGSGGSSSAFFGAGGGTSTLGGSYDYKGGPDGSYIVQGSDGKWYQTSSAAQGYADGFMVKNMDRYKNDGLSANPWMNIDANEALIPLDKLWTQMDKMGGNTYVYDFHDNNFRTEDDIYKAIKRAKKDDRLQQKMTLGGHYSNKGGR